MNICECVHARVRVPCARVCARMRTRMLLFVTMIVHAFSDCMTTDCNLNKAGKSKQQIIQNVIMNHTHECSHTYTHSSLHA